MKIRGRRAAWLRETERKRFALAGSRTTTSAKRVAWWRVTELRLGCNHLRSYGEELPLGIFEKLPHLEVLDLRANRLEGKIPIDLALCTKLRVLSLQANPGLIAPRNAPLDVELGMCYRDDDFFAAVQVV